jgi:hypothetical protein
VARLATGEGPHQRPRRVVEIIQGQLDALERAEVPENVKAIRASS